MASVMSVTPGSAAKTIEVMGVNPLSVNGLMEN